MIVIELHWGSPWIRIHRYTKRAPFGSTAAVRTPPAHCSWVMTDQGLGFLDHHEASGWWIRLGNGRLIQRPTHEFDHVSAPSG